MSLYVLNCLAFTSNILVNLITGISERREIVDHFYRAAPQLGLLSLSLYFAKRKQYIGNALIYALLGLLSMFTREYGNYSGAVFILFSSYIYRTRKTDCILLVIVFVSLVARTVIFKFSVPNVANILIAYSFIIAIYYILIYPKEKKQRFIVIPSPSLDEVTLEIISRRACGESYKDIAAREIRGINLSADTTKKRVAKARKLVSAKNTEHLIGICYNKGLIRPKRGD